MLDNNGKLEFPELLMLLKLEKQFLRFSENMFGLLWLSEICFGSQECKKSINTPQKNLFFFFSQNANPVSFFCFYPQQPPHL